MSQFFFLSNYSNKANIKNKHLSVDTDMAADTVHYFCDQTLS